MTCAPAGIATIAILWPAGTGSWTAIVLPSTLMVTPAASGTLAMATLSVGWRTIAEFSAVGSLAISTRFIAPTLSQLSAGQESIVRAIASYRSVRRIFYR